MLCYNSKVDRVFSQYQINHSYSLNKPPLTAYVSVEKQIGVIWLLNLKEKVTCCSHVGAKLYHLWQLCLWHHMKTMNCITLQTLPQPPYVECCFNLETCCLYRRISTEWGRESHKLEICMVVIRPILWTDNIRIRYCNTVWWQFVR